MINYIFKVLNKIRCMSLARETELYIRSTPSLQNIMDNFGATSFCGISRSDCMDLHRWVREHKPEWVLECGTGKSTHVIADALKTNRKGNVISMESKEEWYKHAVESLPDHIKDHVQIVHSPIDLWEYGFLRGTVYESIPARPYDFAFIDGPSQMIDGVRLCNLDFVRHVACTDHPAAAMIDGRKHTVAAYTLIFGQKKVYFDRSRTAGFVSPVNQHDMALVDIQKMTRNIFPDVVRIK